MPTVKCGFDPLPVWQPSKLAALEAMAANVDDGSVTKRMLGSGHVQRKSSAWMASRLMAGAEIMSHTSRPTWSMSAEKTVRSRG